MISSHERDWPPTLNITPNGQGRPRRIAPASGIVALNGFAMLPLGVIGWAWAGDWRWALTGLMVMLILFVISGLIIMIAPAKPTR